MGVLVITIVGGTALALLLDQPFWGQGIVRILVIAPFFVMPTVSALVWKNMFMNPVNGLFAHLAKGLGLEPFDFLAHALARLDHPDRRLPVAALCHPDPADRPAVARPGTARGVRDGRRQFGNRFIYIVLPHMARAITVVILIQTIFLLSVFAEILVTTNGGPGYASTNITYLVYAQSLLQFDVGAAPPAASLPSSWPTSLLSS